MLTTMVENWPGFRDGIMGPDLMAEMRAQAERFGAEIIQGDVTRSTCRSARSRSRRRQGLYTADALILATGASAKWLDLGVDKQLLGPRRVDLRHLRRLLLSRAGRSPWSAAATPRSRRRSILSKLATTSPSSIAATRCAPRR